MNKKKDWGKVVSGWLTHDEYTERHGQPTKAQLKPHGDRFRKTPYGVQDMNPPYLSLEYMDNDAGIARAHYRRLDREKAGIKDNEDRYPDYIKARLAVVRKQKLKEDVPANCIGASSSTPGTGAIDTYDPLLGDRKKRRKERFKSMLRRKAPK